jgi:hypothetical protein
MATNVQLHALITDESTSRNLKSSVIAAMTLKAVAVAGSVTPTAEALAWAARALTSPERESVPVYAFVIADNSTATVAELRALPDATVQASVDKAVDQLLSKVG